MWEYDDRRQAQEMSPGIWLGPYSAAKYGNFMTSAGLSHVLIVTSELEAKFLNPLFSDRLVYKTLVLEESPFVPIFPVLVEAIQWIRTVIREGGRILVHGNSGMCRSAAVVMGYLIAFENFTFEQAHRHIQRIRHCISLSDSLRNQLRAFEPYVRSFQPAAAALPDGNSAGRKRGCDDITPEPAELFFEDKYRNTEH
jgi:serine/threonine/tyrosine-interacting protein